MSLEDLLNHPDPVFHGVPLDQVPPDVADSVRWLVYKDDCRDRGVPEDQILSYAAWKAGVNG